MAQTSHLAHHTEPDHVHVKQVGADVPGKWLIAAWHDLRAAPAASLAYGFIFALLGITMVWAVIDTQYLVLALITGFLLMGPFLAIGLYDISRSVEEGKKASLWHALTSWRHRADSIMMVAIIPGIIMAAWVRFSALLVGMFFNEGVVTSSETLVADMFLSQSALMFWLIYFCVGAVLAAFVFAISAVSIPLCLEKDVDCITATKTSFQSVMKNKGQMILWALSIVLLTGIGFMTLGLGLIVTIPLIGFATWHAYRDLVESD